MERDKLSPFMRPAGKAGEVFQRKLDAQRDVERLSAVVQSVQRKLDGGSVALTAGDLTARQRELIEARTSGTRDCECRVCCLGTLTTKNSPAGPVLEDEPFNERTYLRNVILA